MTGVELIAAERTRQIEQEGWGGHHDDGHINGSLVTAAIRYAAATLPNHPALQRAANRSWRWASH